MPPLPPPDITAPVNLVDTGSSHDRGDRPDPGTGLCLSGGGYRAMLFHLGALWRLKEWGRLKQLNRISSVSGGSITAGMFDANGVGQNLIPEVVMPIRGIADRTIDEGS